LVKNFSDAPWNELWTDDSDEEGPVLIFRPAPFQDIDGKWIGGATDPGVIPLDYADAMMIDVGRSDERLANFFYTPPGQSLLDTPNAIGAWDILQGNPFDFSHANNIPSLYGYRKMEFPTQLYPDSLTDYPRNQAPSQQNATKTDLTTWHVQRAQLMRDMNHDNVVFEEGTIRARGREDFKPGQYLSFTRGKVVSRAYITRVSHNISPFGSWGTMLGLERGTGFLVRNKMQGSPYFAEGRPNSDGSTVPTTGSPA
jgi:hypothetical protein